MKGEVEFPLINLEDRNINEELLTLFLALILVAFVTMYLDVESHSLLNLELTWSNPAVIFLPLMALTIFIGSKIMIGVIEADKDVS